MNDGVCSYNLIISLYVISRVSQIFQIIFHTIQFFFNQKSQISQTVADDYVCFVAELAVPHTMSITEIEKATENDPTMQELIRLISCNSWFLLNNPRRHFNLTKVNLTDLKSFRQLKDELSVSPKGNIVLRGHCIIIPKSLHQRAVDLAHQNHFGIVKTKQLLRSKIWFPGIDKYVENLVVSCILCQAIGPPKPPQLLFLNEMPKHCWDVVNVDFLGPLPSGHYLLTVIDQKSRFPEVEILSSTSAPTVLPKLDKIFATHGLPKILVSDNGPPFSGTDFEKYLKVNDISHKPTPPKWPKANGLVETFNKPLLRAIRTAHTEGRN